MPKVSTNINLDPNLKKSAQELFYDLGLDLTTAVTLFLKQAVRQQRIPFEIKRAAVNPYEALTEYEILTKLEKSRENAENGMYKDASEVSADIRRKYGL